MKRWLLAAVIMFTLWLAPQEAGAQCSICTKTAQQMGDKPAKGLNSAIFYLAFTPLLLIGFIGYRWYKGQKEE
jgi:hypothetical protein